MTFSIYIFGISIRKFLAPPLPSSAAPLRRRPRGRAPRPARLSPTLQAPRRTKSAIATADAGNHHAMSSPSKPLPRVSAMAAATNAVSDAGSAAMVVNAGSV